jgi:hypothetical protein
MVSFALARKSAREGFDENETSLAGLKIRRKNVVIG